MRGPQKKCCYTGVVQASMDRLKKGLNEREQKSRVQDNWFQSWFNQSPQLTTLLSAIKGPLVLLLLLLTIGPCIINRLVAFIAVMIIRQQYEALNQVTQDLQDQRSNKKKRGNVKEKFPEFPDCTDHLPPLHNSGNLQTQLQFNFLSVPTLF